jgi:hypothetical protein
MGLLSGKYRSAAQAGRLALDASGTGLGLFNERNARIVATLEKTAAEVGCSMAQVALNWVINRPGVAAAIVGASKLEQLEDNMAALDFELAADQRAALDAASATEAPYPYSLFADDYQAGILNTGSSVGEKPKTYRSDIFLPKVADYVFGQPKKLEIARTWKDRDHAERPALPTDFGKKNGAACSGDTAVDGRSAGRGRHRRRRVLPGFPRPSIWPRQDAARSCSKGRENRLWRGRSQCRADQCRHVG